MNELYLSKAKEILDEWEGDVLELDYKISNREIPKHDNADAKMKIELWFGLQCTLQYIEALKLKIEIYKEFIGIVRHNDYWPEWCKLVAQLKQLTAEEQEDDE